MRQRLVSLFTACLACALTSCSAAAPSGPPLDPFSTVAAQADQAYQQGMALYQDGRRREALDAFQRARLLSPTDDPRLDARIAELAAELTPTATPAPATSTPAPQPTPIVANAATPSAALGQEYFGQVFLTIVPGRDGVPPALSQFSDQDQIGLYVEQLDQRLHLAFELRVFELDSGRLVADGSSDRGLVRFLDKFVWHHQGGDPVGNYHAELYAGGVLTHTFDYVVANAPVAIPTDTPAPRIVLQSTAVIAEAPTPKPPPVTPPLAPAPRPTPLPPAPTLATMLSVPAGPAAVEAPDSSAQVYVADRSGLVWTLDHAQPTLRRPFSVSGVPVGLAADAAAGRLYVAVRSPSALLTLDAATGQQVASVPLAGDPGDVRLDATLGLLFVVVPDRETVETIDVRDPKIVRSTDGLAQVTGLALDQDSHILYLSQLSGQLALLDGPTGAVTDHIALGGVGLSGVATGDGRVYAINTPGRGLLAIDPSTGEVSNLPLGAEPAAFVIGPHSGAAYVLEPAAGAVVRLDLASGAELGRVSLGQDPQESASFAPDQLWLRPRLAISPVDETVYVIEPQAGMLALAPPPP